MRRTLALACLFVLFAPTAAAGISVGAPVYPAPVFGMPQLACASTHFAADGGSCNVAGPVSNARAVSVSAQGMLVVRVFVLDEDHGRTLASFDCAAASCQRAFLSPVTARTMRLVVFAEALAPGASAVVSVGA